MTWDKWDSDADSETQEKVSVIGKWSLSMKNKL